MHMKELSRRVMEYVLGEGACAAGIVTVEGLAGGSPSSDLSYVLPGAKSAISFALPMDQHLIRPYLTKKDRRSHERDNLRANGHATGLASHVANYLNHKGYRSVPVLANEVYRQDTPRGVMDMYPDISLRYLAVRSGVGSFGWSGNVHTPKEGGAVILGATVTTAELEPTDPLPEDENYCDRCKLCMASCAAGLMDDKEEHRVSLGGVEFSYSKRRSYHRCDFVCGGFTGLHRSGKWSTWSPGRFPIPEKDEEFLSTLIECMQPYGKRPRMEGGHFHPLMEPKLNFTCGNCQLVCHPDRDERKRRYKMLTTSGVVVQNEDGSLEAVSPDEARKRLAAMSPERRALYEKPAADGDEQKEAVRATSQSVGASTNV
jgi:epoxyqueuosine reductase QueG